MKKGAWFGLACMAVVVILVFSLMPWGNMTSGHLGLLMLAMITIAIMLGFPTAFTLMGMGTLFAWLAYRSTTPDTAVMHVLDLVVARAFAVMNNDVLISIPLFVFMGYLVERANLIERLFKSLHLATARIPGSLAVATIVTCTIFATATGIIGAAVTLMGLLAFPAMLKAGYNIRLSAGSVCAGGTLGIMIPPSVLLILYGATASVSVVQLYAGAFIPGAMLSALYVGYIIVSTKIKPSLAPPLSEEDQRVDLPQFMEVISKTRSKNALIGLIGEIKSKRNPNIPKRTLYSHLLITLLPIFAAAFIVGSIYFMATAPEEAKVEGVQAMGMAAETTSEETKTEAGGLQEPEEAGGLKEPPAETKPETVPAPGTVAEAPKPPAEVKPAEPAAAPGERKPVPMWYWITVGVHVALFIGFYSIFNFTRLEIFKLLLTSFFPLALIILGVLGSIVAGLATPTEAASMGAFGGLVLAAAYGQLNFKAIKESVFLTAKTSAMVCWLFIGSSVFAAAFALLGGQEVVNQWVLSLDVTPTQFLIMAQVVIFLLGWPLEWTEIIVIFMPIFLPLLTHFNIDPLFFGLLVALNLQTAFLSPPVAMAAFYLKGVSPPHVTLNQIFLGMLPFMALQVVAIALLYIFPQIGLWLPTLAYNR
ncbi:MAG: TRAP transporter large permease subunit [Deltaproteobacteria bacterium]|nr:TRAP transporter large permease subunit [Deltaproteobacteria bacterium]